MITKKVEIKARTGLHARPAAALVDTANEFQSELKLIHENREASLKSIVSLMSLVVMQGETVTLQAEGEDEEEAVHELLSLIEEILGSE